MPETFTIECGHEDCACRADLDRLMGLAGIICEDIAGYDLKAKYEHFNRTLFDGKLPDIPVTWFKSKKVGGVATGDVEWIGPKPDPTRVRFGLAKQYDNARIKEGTMHIKISDLYKRSEQALDGILIHECIHVWFFSQGDLNESHGQKFQEMVKKLSAKVGYEIPLTDDARNLEVQDHNLKPVAVVVREHDDGTITYGLTSPNLIQANLEAIKKNESPFRPYYAKRVTVYVITSPAWAQKASNMPLQRKFNYKFGFWVMRDEALMSELREQGKIILDLPREDGEQ